MNGKMKILTICYQKQTNRQKNIKFMKESKSDMGWAGDVQTFRLMCAAPLTRILYQL